VNFVRLGARRRALVALGVLALAACSGSRPKPTPVASVPAKIAGRLAWSAKVDSVQFPLVPVVRDGRFLVAGSDGTLLQLDAETGRELFRASAGAPISAGVGSDGRFHAVVTVDNQLVVLDGTQVAWRAPLKSRVSTPPLVAGERVFVMGVDRAVHAFDAVDGRRLWTLQRPGEALTLLHSGLLTAVRNTLIAGQGSRMAGIDPTNGSLLWEVPVASPRGTNEVERLADLIGPATRLADRLCVRSFQSAVGCVDADRGVLLWFRLSGGVNAVAGDDELIFGADGSDRIVAWRTANGETTWTNERLLFRQLSAPAVAGPTVVFGDYEGMVHFLDRKDGSPLLMLSTDGSAVVGKPMLAGTTLLVVTRKGGLFAFRPQ
jgi:outer membrane assembly lipoprotein YfgL